MVHLTYLTIQTFFVFPIVNHLEMTFIQWLLIYFFRSSKRHLELAMLGEIMEKKGLKILNDVKTH
jgi:hypothetical protein